MSTETIKTEIIVDSGYLLDNFMGCGWEFDPVALSFIINATYYNNEVHLTYENSDQEVMTAQLTTTDLAKGLSKAIEAGAAHCGSYINANFDEWDACVGTAILQFALFGEEVFG